MAVKAKCEITLYRVIDIDKVTRYYLLQSSTATAPSKPTANPPGENWKTTEPSYTSGSTNTLYFVDLTVMTNGSFSYSAVSKSSSYEAAKEAWNKANNAQNTANNVNGKIDDLQIGGRNLLVQKNITQGYLSTDGKGSFVGSDGGDQTSDWIDVSGNKYITITLYEDFTNTNNSGRYCEYDADKNCINTVGYNPRQKSSIIIELKSNTKYIRVTAIECKTRRYKIEKGNKATDWTPAPEDTEEKIETASKDAAKTATNYLKGSEDGLVIGNMTDEMLGSNVLINPDSVNIRDGDTILARYSERKIELGLNSEDAVIELCGGVGLITSQVVEESEFSTGITRALSIESDYIQMNKARIIELDTNTLYGTNADGEGQQASSYITLNSGKSSNGLHNSTFIIGGLVYEDNLNAFISGDISELDGILLTTRVTGADKSTDITISHSSTDASVDYEGMTIESCDVVRFQSNINMEYCIGVGVGGGGVNRGIHDTSEDHWMLYCDQNDMYFQAPKTSKIKPYYRAGDSIQLYYQGAGFATSGGKYVVFTIPINKPIDASNVVASSVSGFIGRSNGKYTHGSASSTYVKPASYEAAINGNAVRVSMNFNNNANVTNNAAIGVTWSGKITFS